MRTTPALDTSPNSKDQSHWHDWRWQQRSAVRTAEQLRQNFPGLHDHEVEQIRAAEAAQRYQLTPYVSLIETEAAGRPVADDPIWKISVPESPGGPQEADLGLIWVVFQSPFPSWQSRPWTTPPGEMSSGTSLVDGIMTQQFVE